MRVDVVTIFPEYFAPLDVSLHRQGTRARQLDVHVHDLRDWAHDGHRTVDDTPYGGGPGMVMKTEPWGEALDAVLAGRSGRPAPRLVVPTPSGRPFTQELAVEYAAEPWLMFTPRPLRGHRLPGHRRVRRPDAGRRGRASATTCWPAARRPYW